MKNFQPMGMIPEFNAWGNHPADMEAFIQTKVKELYQNAGISGYEEGEKILLRALDSLSVRSSDFTGHFIPCEKTRPVLSWLLDTFVQFEKCKFFGLQNYKKAIDLINSGHNVLVVMNHATALDCLIAESLTSRIRPSGFQPSYIASQVFEYARIANITTSGFDKYPVFQSKHIQRMKDLGGSDCVLAEMRRQNKITIRSICCNMRVGGKMVLLFPEKNRSAEMGVPEPVVAKLPCLMQSASRKELYVLPMYVSGGETIFPNVPGTNELDNFLQNIRVGSGDAYCGELVPFSKINDILCCVDKEGLVQTIMGEIPSCKDYLRLSALSVLITGLIARLSPAQEKVLLYKNDYVEKATEMILN
jgi:1-acyl-sn-glycerol-3-phosphate acyltransferase